MNSWRLDGMKAIITGGTVGIGRAAADEFLLLGAEVLVVARNQEVIDEMIELHKEKGHLIYGIAADIGVKEDRERIIQWVQQNWDALDVLVNNVGTNVRKPTLEIVPEEMNHVFDVNATAAFHLSQMSYEWLKKSDHPSIINVGSIASKQIIQNTTAIYSMSKAAMNKLTDYLAVSWGRDGIRVNSVDPWYIRTPRVARVVNDPEKYAKVLERTPLNKIGEPEDVGRTIAFLAMPAAAFINGQNIAIDGGFSKLGI
ncbi:MAG: SDR family oxidoreductase [Bacteroidota bacterium]